MKVMYKEWYPRRLLNIWQGRRYDELSLVDTKGAYIKKSSFSVDVSLRNINMNAFLQKKKLEVLSVEKSIFVFLLQVVL